MRTHDEDLRSLPLSERKARLLASKPAGIVFNEHTDEDCVTVFRNACKLGFEGIVSKRLAALPVRSIAGMAQGESTQTARRCDGRKRGWARRSS